MTLISTILIYDDDVCAFEVLKYIAGIYLLANTSGSLKILYAEKMIKRQQRLFKISKISNKSILSMYIYTEAHFAIYICKCRGV